MDGVVRSPPPPPVSARWYPSPSCALGPVSYTVKREIRHLVSYTVKRGGSWSLLALMNKLASIVMLRFV